MAVQQKIPAYHRPVPISEKLRDWAADTLECIRRNFRTQGIFPVGEVYSGWFEKNAGIRGSSWKSTGAGFDSFYLHSMHASEQLDVGVRNWAVEFVYDYYLKFVEMGVGKGRPIGKVNRTLDASYDMRYMDSWNPSEGSTQRPAIMMEFRFQASRMRRYMAERYKYDAQVIIVSALDGLDVNVGDDGGNTT